MPGTGEQVVDSLGSLELATLLLFATILYLLPLAVAAVRGTKRARHIALLDVCLGWTVIGWGIALLWATVDGPADDGPAYREPVRISLSA